MTRISKSTTPSSVSAAAVRRTVSAITASSLYAGSTALTEGWTRMSVTFSVTSAPTADVVDGDVVGASDDGKPLIRPPADALLGVDRTRVGEPVVDLHVADAVPVEQGEDGAGGLVCGTPRVHGL